MTRCLFGDPHCPCQDGDACHYRSYPGSPAMDPPAVFRAAKRVAEIFKAAHANMKIRTPDVDHLTAYETRRWLACIDAARALTGDGT